MIYQVANVFKRVIKDICWTVSELLENVFKCVSRFLICFEIYECRHRSFFIGKTRRHVVKTKQTRTIRVNTKPNSNNYSVVDHFEPTQCSDGTNSFFFENVTS